jgi:hypothetical protein
MELLVFLEHFFVVPNVIKFISEIDYFLMKFVKITLCGNIFKHWVMIRIEVKLNKELLLVFTFKADLCLCIKWNSLISLHGFQNFIRSLIARISREIRNRCLEGLILFISFAGCIVKEFYLWLKIIEKKYLFC